jgi:hypothetical protein
MRLIVWRTQYPAVIDPTVQRERHIADGVRDR